jgi:hypothetical protein
MQYRCAEDGCPAVLSIATNAANVQRRNLLRVTVRIVHKHNHKWDPPRLDLSQLVEAVIEEHDLMDEEESEDHQSSSLDGNHQISLVTDPAYYATQNGQPPQQQQPVMTLYFNKFGNSYVTQNVSLLANGHSSNALSELVLVNENTTTKLEKAAGGERVVVENGEYDSINQFKRVCGDITVMIQQDPDYFAEAVQQFERAFDRICTSKCDLLRALREFGKNDEDVQDAYEGN